MAIGLFLRQAGKTETRSRRLESRPQGRTHRVEMYKCALRCSLRDIALPSASHLSVVVVCWRQEVRYGKRETARSAGSEAQAAWCANSGTEGKRTDAGPQRRYAPQSTYGRRDAQDGEAR